jgi:hypothetical protein
LGKYSTLREELLGKESEMAKGKAAVKNALAKTAKPAPVKTILGAALAKPTKGTKRWTNET